MRNPLFDRKPIGQSIVAEVAREFALKKAGLWQSSRAEQYAKDRHCRLTKQRWSGTDEKEWIENGKTTVPRCEPGPSVSGDSTSED